MSETSSGRSSTSSTYSAMSGWFRLIALAMDWSITVFPARGGATISPRWPTPIGATRSTIRAARSSRPFSSRIIRSGWRATRLSNSTRSGWVSAGAPFTSSRSASPK